MPFLAKQLHSLKQDCRVVGTESMTKTWCIKRTFTLKCANYSKTIPALSSNTDSVLSSGFMCSLKCLLKVQECIAVCVKHETVLRAWHELRPAEQKPEVLTANLCTTCAR